MNATLVNTVQEQSFDLFRLSKSKQVVDLSPNTLRDYQERGLRFYQCGKPIFISKIELANFIRSGGPMRPRKSASPKRHKTRVAEEIAA